MFKTLRRQHPADTRIVSIEQHSNLDSTSNLSHRLLYGILFFTRLRLCQLYLAAWPIIF